MAATQRRRDVLTGSPTLEYLIDMGAAGWRLTALEWERQSNSLEIDSTASADREIEIPYGLRISDDGRHLIESTTEMRVLMSSVNMIVDDFPMSGIADELNRQGYRTRRGSSWTPAAVFDLLPRMIEAGPQIFTTEEWVDRRRRLIRD